MCPSSRLSRVDAADTGHSVDWGKYKKGFGKYILDLARKILESVFVPGSVCLFDLLQDLDLSLSEESNDQLPLQPSDVDEDTGPIANATAASLQEDIEEEPQWVLSSPVIERKSTFIARVCSVTSPTQARACVAHLLDTDKRVSKATHNICAYRIRSTGETTSSEIVYQDCDDDGETAAGGRLLHLLQVMDVWDLLVVVSRWYGGVKLGPDRFSIINKVARKLLLRADGREADSSSTRHGDRQWVKTLVSLSDG